MSEPLQLIPARTSWIGNTFSGGNSWVQNFVDDMVVSDGRCYTNSGWDEAHNERGIYWVENGAWNVETHGMNSPAVSSKTATVSGETWTISDAKVSGPGGQLLSDVQKATALGVYLPLNLLMVCDDASHVIKFFDVSAVPARLVKTFGTPGGIGSGIPGRMGPLKFLHLTGCGSDSAGNLYTASSQQGVILRQFRVIDAANMLWDEVNVLQAIGLHFQDSSDFDPALDGIEIHGKDERYVMDYSKPAGQEATLVSITTNPDIDPNDPRLVNRGGVKVRYKDGKKFLFFLDHNSENVHVYGYDEGSEVAIRFASIRSPSSRGLIVNVDDNCDIWGWNEYDGGTIDVLRCTGVSGSALTYAPSKVVFSPFPAPFKAVGGLLYDSGRDVMYLGGGTAESPIEGWGHPGPVIAKYENWSGAKNLAWQVKVPWYHSEAPVGDRVVPMCWDFAGNRLYIAYLVHDSRERLPAPYQDTPGPIRVYNTNNGAFVGRLLAGPEVQYGSGWMDFPHAVSSFERSNGDHVILREEVWKNKQIMFTYKPQMESPALNFALSWNAVQYAERYGVYENGVRIAEISDTTFSLEGKVGPKTYSVTAVNASGESPRSNEVILPYTAPIPVAPMLELISPA